MAEKAKIMFVGDCLSLIKNGANIKQDRGASGIPITRIETLSGGVFNRDRLGYANIDSVEKYKSYVLESGDLLFSHINSKTYIGRTVLYEKEGDETIIHGMNLLRLKVIPDIITPKFFYYLSLTESFKEQVAASRKDAVNQSSISVADIKKIRITVPSIEEQNRIVSELDLLANVIEKKKEQIRDFDTLSLSSFDELFGGLDKNPNGWPTKKLCEICSFYRGLTYAKPDEVPFSSKIVLRSNNVDLDSHSLLIDEDLKYLREDFVIPEEKRVTKDSILMCMSNGSRKHVGKVAYIDKDYGYAFGGFMGLLKPVISYTPIYVFYALLSPDFKGFLNRIGEGIGILNLKFSRLTCKVPCLSYPKIL